MRLVHRREDSSSTISQGISDVSRASSSMSRFWRTAEGDFRIRTIWERLKVYIQARSKATQSSSVRGKDLVEHVAAPGITSKDPAVSFLLSFLANNHPDALDLRKREAFLAKLKICAEQPDGAAFKSLKMGLQIRKRGSFVELSMTGPTAFSKHIQEEFGAKRVDQEEGGVSTVVFKFESEEKFLAFLGKAGIKRSVNASLWYEVFANVKISAEQIDVLQADAQKEKGVGYGIFENKIGGYSFVSCEKDQQRKFIFHEQPLSRQEVEDFTQGRIIRTGFFVGKKAFLYTAEKKEKDAIAYGAIPVVSRLGIGDKKEYGCICEGTFDHYQEREGRLEKESYTLLQPEDLIGKKLQEKLASSSRQGIDTLCLAAVVVGQGRILMEHEGKLYAVVMKKGEGNTLRLTATETSLSETDMVSEDMRALLEKTEHVGEKSLLTVAKEVAKGKKVAETPLFEGKTVIRLRIHDDSTVTLALSKKIGEGGAGVVFKVQKFGMQIKEYVKKQLRGTTEFSTEDVSSLRKEGLTYLEYHHPHIVSGRKVEVLGECLAVPLGSSTPIAVENVAVQMEFCDKGSCEKLEETPPKSISEWKERGKAIYEAALGMQYIHMEKEMALMDFKGANILRTTQANGSVVAKLSDLNPNPDGTKGVAVTPNYLDPEAFQGGKVVADRKCDVWALGIVLYNFAYGRDQNPIGNGDRGSFEQNVESLLKKLREDADPSHKKLNMLLLKIFSSRKERPEITDDFLAELKTAIDAFIPKTV